MPELKITLALVKDEKDHCFAQFLKDVDSMKMMNLRDKRHAEFQNEIDSLKMLIKVWSEQHAQYQNAMDSVMVMERTPLISMKQAVSHLRAIS